MTVGAAVDVLVLDGCLHEAQRAEAAAKSLKAAAILNSFGVAQDHQHYETQRLPFTAMMAAIYREMAEMLGWNKPDPQIFAFTRGRLSKEDSSYDDIIQVAQSQYHDIAVARRLGYHTCWIERRKGKQGAGATPTVQKVAIPDYHFGSLVELADAVDSGK